MRSQPKYMANGCSNFFALMLVLCLGATWGAHAYAQDGQNNCGSIANHYGPFDYRTQRDKLKIVEQFHFTSTVESLRRGHTSIAPGPDIAYTLHTSPNHHRALMALLRLAEKMKTPQPQGMSFPVECYFDRAIRFASDDTVVRILYAQFLSKRDRLSESLQQLDAAVLNAKDNSFSHYNIGLAYFDLKQFDKALTQAHKAAALGFERTELADLLKGASKWREPSN